MKKRYIVPAVLSTIAISLGVGLVVINQLKDEETASNQQEKSPALLSGDSYAKDIITPSIDEIRSKYQDEPDKQFAELLSAGLKKKDFLKYDEAIAYLEAAVDVAPDPAQKLDTQQVVYYTAVAAKNSAVEQKYKDILGTKLNEQSVQGVPQDI